MKTNGRIWLDRFELKSDRDNLAQIIASFPINLEVSPSKSLIDVSTYDDGRANSSDRYFKIILTPESDTSSCERLHELDRQRYEISFESSFGTFGPSELIIKDTQERYILSIQPCRGK